MNIRKKKNFYLDSCVGLILQKYHYNIAEIKTKISLPQLQKHPFCRLRDIGLFLSDLV